MIQFLREALSERGSASSKRISWFLILFVFLFIVIYNILTGKKPDETLASQLFYAFLYVGGLVFGANILNTNKDIKIAQSNNNAATGNPSPTPPPADVTIVKP